MSRKVFARHVRRGLGSRWLVVAVTAVATVQSLVAGNWWWAAAFPVIGALSLLRIGWLLWLLVGVAAITFVLVENGVPDDAFSAIVLAVGGAVDLWFIRDAVHEVRSLRKS